MNCRCEQFGTIGLTREEIVERIKRTRTFRRRLETIAEHPLTEHKLLKCLECEQHWQISRAWNWGNYEYLFKVPAILPDEWLAEPYEQPDELLIYSAVLQNYVEGNDFAETENGCRGEGCAKRAIKYTVFCRDHHIKSLQVAGVLPKEPEGRRLPEYTGTADRG